MEIVSLSLNSEQKEAYLKALADRLADRAEIVFAYTHGGFLEGGRFRDLDVAVFLRPDFAAAKGSLYETELEGELQKSPQIKPNVF